MVDQPKTPPGISLQALAFLSAAVLGLGLVIYGDSLTGYFLADDFAFVHRSHLKWQSGLAAFFSDFHTQDPVANFLRPITSLSLGVDYALFGVDPIGYRIVNLLVHVLCALALATLVWRISKDRLVAWLTGCLFVAFPGHSETVAWIVARDESLAALFLLLAGHTTLAQRLKWRLLGLLFLPLAAWSKESGLVGAALLSVFVFCDPTGPRSLVSRIGITVRRSMAAWVCIGLVLVHRFWILGRLGGRYTGAAEHDYASLAFWQDRSDYLQALLVPLRHDSYTTTLLVVVAVFHLMLVLAGRAAKRGPRWNRGLLLAIGICLLPYVWFKVDLQTLAGSRHLYPAAAPVCVLLACAGTSVLRWLAERQQVLAWGLAVAWIAAAVVAARTGVACYRMAGELMPKLVASAHEVLDREVRQQAGADVDQVVLEGLSWRFRGAQFGFGVMGGLTFPPFRTRPTPKKVVILTDREPEILIPSHLADALGSQTSRRYRWSPDAERFQLRRRDPNQVVVRGRLQATQAGWRLEGVGIALRDTRSILPALSGRLVEVRGKRSRANDGSEQLVVASVRKVEPVLRLVREPQVGGAAVVRVVGPPGQRMFLLSPRLPGFHPVGEHGSLLVSEVVPPYRSVVVPASGFLDHALPVPDRAELAGHRVAVQAILYDECGVSLHFRLTEACTAIIQPRSQ